MTSSVCKEKARHRVQAPARVLRKRGKSDIISVLGRELRFSGYNCDCDSSRHSLDQAIGDGVHDDEDDVMMMMMMMTAIMVAPLQLCIHALMVEADNKGGVKVKKSCEVDAAADDVEGNPTGPYRLQCQQTLLLLIIEKVLLYPRLVRYMV